MFESEIDADRLAVQVGFYVDCDVDTEVPVSAGVFGEATGSEGVGTESVGVPDVEVVFSEPDAVVFPGSASAFEGYPAEGIVASASVGGAPPESFFSCCFLFGSELLSDFLDGAVADELEIGRASGAELIEIEACQVLSVVAPIFSVCLIAIVPDEVDFGGHAAQEGNVFILDADLECFGENSAHMCIIRAVGLKGKGRRLSALRR